MELSIRLVIVLVFQAFLIKAQEKDDVTIICSKDAITVTIKRTFIPDFYLEDLGLLDSKCDFHRTANYTHFKVTIPLMDCGTLSVHTNDSIIYSNMIKNKPFGEKAVINRLPYLEIPIKCSYPKKVATSYADLGVKKSLLELDVEDGSGEFDLHMSLFKDNNYVNQYVNYPVTVPLNQRLYFQINVDSIDKGLSIVADTCYATPTQMVATENKYLIIEERCPKDSTFKTHPSPPWAQRFSFQAFQFVYSTDVPYVFIHCEVRLCNATDESSLCAKGCGNDLTDKKSRRRRDEMDDLYSIEQGPIIIVIQNDRQYDSPSQHKDSSFSAPHWIVIGMGFICLLCLLVVLYTRHQLMKIRSENVEKTTRL